MEIAPLQQAVHVVDATLEPTLEEQNADAESTPPVDDSAEKKLMKDKKGTLMLVTEDGVQIKDVVYVTHLAAETDDNGARTYGVGTSTYAEILEAFDRSGQFAARSTLEQGKPATAMGMAEILATLSNTIYLREELREIGTDVAASCGHIQLLINGTVETIIFEGKLKVVEKNYSKVVSVLPGDLVRVGGSIGVFMGLLRGEHKDEFVVYTSSGGNEVAAGKAVPKGKRSAVKKDLPVSRVLLVVEDDTPIFVLNDRADPLRLWNAMEALGCALKCYDSLTG